ncbi:MAG: DUF4142 domain-containing protein [Solirubrobacterales bacterium]|nr:DUF4142 domain-containing protein [Solirubrobacterales bacterium]
MKRISVFLLAGAALLALALPLTSAGAATTASACGLDKVWIKVSTQTDLAEIQAGNAVLQVSKNAAVRRLATRTRADHTAAYAQAKTLAAKYRLRVATAPSPTQVWEFNAVAGLRNRQRAFNIAYASNQVAGHLQAIDLANTEVSAGCAAGVKANAKTALPMLRMHLALARAALRASR